MCKVVVDNTERNADFIIYNHLFSKVNCNFTVPQLVEELQVYNLELSQEYVQAETRSALTYRLDRKEGTANEPTFTMSVLLEGIVLGTGSGRSKKEASQSAAKNALSKMAKN